MGLTQSQKERLKILEQQFVEVKEAINQHKCDSLLHACRIFNFKYNNLYGYIKKYHSDFECSRLNNGKSRSSRKAQEHFKKLKDEDKEKIVELYVNQHLTMYQIAEFLNCSASAVCQYFAKHGIKARSKSENGIYVYKNNEVYREYVRERNIQTYLKRRTHSTKPEIQFANFCRENDIAYIEQYRQVGNKHPYDFFLQDCNLLVEIDGTYWHSTPEQKVKDQQHVDDALAKGYNIVRIDTSELAKENGDYWKWLKKWIL